MIVLTDSLLVTVSVEPVWLMVNPSVPIAVKESLPGSATMSTVVEVVAES